MVVRRLRTKETSAQRDQISGLPVSTETHPDTEIYIDARAITAAGPGPNDGTCTVYFPGGLVVGQRNTKQRRVPGGFSGSIGSSPTTTSPRGLARWVSWLATWAISSQDHHETTGVLPSRNAFHADLLLPDIDPGDPELLQLLQEHPSAPTPGRLKNSRPDSQTSTPDPRELGGLANQHGMASLVHLAKTRIARFAVETYDIVRIRQ